MKTQRGIAFFRLNLRRGVSEFGASVNCQIPRSREFGHCWGWMGVVWDYVSQTGVRELVRHVARHAPDPRDFIPNITLSSLENYKKPGAPDSLCVYVKCWKFLIEKCENPVPVPVTFSGENLGSSKKCVDVWSDLQYF
jgi:hypothetical protein